MKTLNLYNAEMKSILESRKSSKAGVACDVCNEELHYTDLTTMLLSNPPRMTVTCRNENCKDYNKIKYKVM